MNFNKYKEFFNENGYVHFKRAINFETLDKMNNQLLKWIDESKYYKENYGSFRYFSFFYKG